MAKQYIIDKSKIRAHNIDLSDIPETHSFETEELTALYSKMLMLRCMEEKLARFYDQKKIRGFCHLGCGQEGLYGALCNVIEGDCLISSYRCHGAAFASGSSVKEIICENLGLKEGTSGGKGGSMHLYNDKFFGGHGIVGAQVPLGVGIAFALKYKRINRSIEEDSNKDYKSLGIFQKDRYGQDTGEQGFSNREPWTYCASDKACFCIYGDGASNQGQTHESFNLAKIYNLPVVFIRENNRYGMSTLTERVSMDDNYHTRGHGIPGIRVSDLDIFILIDVLKFAKSHCLERGPIIIQIDTSRICGHSTLDKEQWYRDGRDRRRDPLIEVCNLVIEHCGASSAQTIKKATEQDLEAILSTIDYNAFP